MIKTAKELKAIAEKAQLENNKNLFKHAEIDIEERLMPHLIQKAEKGEREMSFTVDKSLEIFVCTKLRDMGFRVQWSVTDTNYKITWQGERNLALSFCRCIRWRPEIIAHFRHKVKRKIEKFFKKFFIFPK